MTHGKYCNPAVLINTPKIPTIDSIIIYKGYTLPRTVDIPLSAVSTEKGKDWGPKGAVYERMSVFIYPFYYRQAFGLLSEFW